MPLYLVSSPRARRSLIQTHHSQAKWQIYRKTFCRRGTGATVKVYSLMIATCSSLCGGVVGVKRLHSSRAQRDEPHLASRIPNRKLAIRCLSKNRQKPAATGRHPYLSSLLLSLSLRVRVSLRPAVTYDVVGVGGVLIWVLYFGPSLYKVPVLLKQTSTKKTWLASDFGNEI